MENEQTNTNEHEHGKRTYKMATSKLPTTDLIPDDDIAVEVQNLLFQAGSLKHHIATRKKELERIVDRLSIICETFPTTASGIRSGHTGFMYGGWRTRRTLSKEALIEEGVDPAIIMKGYRESKAYLDVSIIDLE